MNRTYLIGLGLLLTAPLIWGGMFSVASMVMPTVDPFTITAIRYGIGAPIFILILVILEGRSKVRFEGNSWRLFFYGTFGFAGFNMLAYIGLNDSSPEHAAIILALMPMITVLVSWLRKGQRPATFTLATVAIAFLGVFLVVTNGHPQLAFEKGEVSGDLLLLIAALCWVIYTLGAGDFPSWSALRYTAMSCTLGTVSIFIITAGLALNGNIHLPTLSVIASYGWEFFYLVILGAVVAVLSWNAGIRIIGPINGVLFINLVPITAFVIGVLQGHLFTQDELIGALLVVLALIANNLYIRQQIEPKPIQLDRSVIKID